MVDPEAGDERADATRERMFGVICFYEGRRDVSSSARYDGYEKWSNGEVHVSSRHGILMTTRPGLPLNHSADDVLMLS